jgi:hypothetical protein
VDFDAYALRAVELVNSPLDSADELVTLLGAAAEAEYRERDLQIFRRTRARLREVFELGAQLRADEAAQQLNALLDAFPVRPRVCGLPEGGWQIQVSGRGVSGSTDYLAQAVWGLAVWLCEHGDSRFGCCADDKCRRVYLDTSSNCCRRFCSERCATRAHVAAHRARKRAGQDVGSGVNGPGGGQVLPGIAQ